MSRRPLRSIRSLFPALLFVVAMAPAVAQDNRPNLDVHFVPTPEQVVERMLELAKVTKDDYVIDLGSGDGRIAIMAAKKYGARALGVDLDPQRIKEANDNNQRSGTTGRVTFRQQNLFETEIQEASVITMYLLTSINMKLRPKLLEVMKPGTRISSHAFDMGDWKPDVQENVDGRRVFFWVVPAKVEGRWEITEGERRITVNLKQRYQEIEGDAVVNGRSVPLRDAKLTGADIEFKIDAEGGPQEFKGKVSGNSIEGKRGSATWRASKSS